MLKSTNNKMQMAQRQTNIPTTIESICMYLSMYLEMYVCI